MTTRSRSAGRWCMLRGILLALLALLLIAFAAGWWLLAGSRARLDGKYTLRGLSASVSISRDALGTATLQGQNRDDLSYRSQGRLKSRAKGALPLGPALILTAADQ